MRSALFSMAK